MTAQDEALRIQLQVAVRAALAAPMRLIADIIRNSPHVMTAGPVLDRDDVRHSVLYALAEAARTTTALVQRAWALSGGPEGAPVRQHLLADVEHAYRDAQGSLEGAIREEFASVPYPDRGPGDMHPAIAAAHARSRAVEQAMAEHADALALRGQLTLGMAAGSSQTAAVLEEGHRRQEAGERVMKVWRSRKTKRTCRWCWQLDGVMIPLDEDFPHGDPIALPQKRTRHVATPEGARHYRRSIGQPIIFTFPPRAYRGRLPGPLRHPNCECFLELVVVSDEAMPERIGSLPAPGEHYVSASDVAALPEEKYTTLVTFMRAAVHELGQLLRKLAGR